MREGKSVGVASHCHIQALAATFIAWPKFIFIKMSKEGPMPWTPDVIDYLLGDDDAFLSRYCSALTLERLAGTDHGLVREVLSRLAEALPHAAHTTPKWSLKQQSIVTIGSASFENHRDGITIKIKRPYVGLAWDHEHRLFLWADPGSTRGSGSTDWHEWATGHDRKSGIRLRFGQSLTNKGAQQDPLAAGRPLHRMFAQFPALITQSEPPVHKADIIDQAIDQACVDIGELDEFEGQPCESLGVIYPRLAARMSGKAEEEGMGLGGAGQRLASRAKVHGRVSAARHRAPPPGGALL